MTTCSTNTDHPALRYGEKLRLLTGKMDEMMTVSCSAQAGTLPDHIKGSTPDLTCSTHSKTGTVNTPVNTLTTAQRGGCKSCPKSTEPEINPLEPFGFSLGGTGFNFNTFFQDLTLMGENSGFPYL